MAQSGFTAVELLITLLVASMFLFSGYQLYTQVNRDGNEANQAARVSNLATEKMKTAITTNSCPYSSTNTVNETGVGPVNYAISVTCPNTDVTTMKYVKVTATYGNPSKTLEHASYAN